MSFFSGDASGCVPWYRVFTDPFAGGLTDSEKACVIAKGKAEIGQVVTNYKDYYHPDNQSLQVVQEFAQNQQNQVENDVNAINKNNCPVDFTGAGLPCFQNWSEAFQWFGKWGFIAALAVGALYVAFLFSTARNLYR